jgi:hypothetical protein
MGSLGRTGDELHRRIIRALEPDWEVSTFDEFEAQIGADLEIPGFSGGPVNVPSVRLEQLWDYAAKVTVTSGEIVATLLLTFDRNR